MLKVLACHLQQIRQQGETTYPEECCGLLLGDFDGNTGIVKEIYPTLNSWDAQSELLLEDTPQKALSRRNRFSIEPRTLLKVQKEARERQLNIIGVYHSHPDYPACPSAFDRAIAWSDYFYIIVSVEQGCAKDLLCWQLDKKHQFQKIPIAIRCKYKSPF